MASPIRFGHHSQKHALVMTWLGVYVAHAPNVVLGDNGTVYLDCRNEVQPDAMLWRPGAGSARVTEEDYVEGAPELVVEVAASSVSYDLHEKKEAYRRNGVREYVVWRVLDGAVDWFELRDGAYVRREPDEQEIIESGSFVGLRLHVPSLLGGDAAGVLAALSSSQEP